VVSGLPGLNDDRNVSGRYTPRDDDGLESAYICRRKRETLPENISCNVPSARAMGATREMGWRGWSTRRGPGLYEHRLGWLGGPPAGGSEDRTTDQRSAGPGCQTLRRAITTVATGTLDELTSGRAVLLRMRSSAASVAGSDVGHRVVAIAIARPAPPLREKQSRRAEAAHARIGAIAQVAHDSFSRSSDRART
jgi:hypothetical protein